MRSILYNICLRNNRIISYRDVFLAGTNWQPLAIVKDNESIPRCELTLEYPASCILSGFYYAAMKELVVKSGMVDLALNGACQPHYGAVRIQRQREDKIMLLWWDTIVRSQKPKIGLLSKGVEMWRDYSRWAPDLCLPFTGGWFTTPSFAFHPNDQNYGNISLVIISLFCTASVYKFCVMALREARDKDMDAEAGRTRAWEMRQEERSKKVGRGKKGREKRRERKREKINGKRWKGGERRRGRMEIRTEEQRGRRG